MPKWNIGLPGGPAGPFYSVVKPTGQVIALQITDKRYAELIADLGAILNCDFDTVHEAGRKLGDIFRRDFPDNAPDEWPVEEGAVDYVIRAVIEALFDRHFQAQ